MPFWTPLSTAKATVVNTNLAASLSPVAMASCSAKNTRSERVDSGFSKRYSLKTQLTNGPLSYDIAVPSGDGKQIFAIGTKRRGELVRYDEKTKHFIPFLGGMSAINPTFSRDGQWMAYTSYPTTHFGVVVRTARTGDSSRIHQCRFRGLSFLRTENRSHFGRIAVSYM